MCCEGSTIQDWNPWRWHRLMSKLVGVIISVWINIHNMVHIMLVYGDCTGIFGIKCCRYSTRTYWLIYPRNRGGSTAFIIEKYFIHCEVRTQAKMNNSPSSSWYNREPPDGSLGSGKNGEMSGDVGCGAAREYCDSSTHDATFISDESGSFVCTFAADRRMWIIITKEQSPANYVTHFPARPLHKICGPAHNSFATSVRLLSLCYLWVVRHVGHCAQISGRIKL
jgi:hypothetical protein